MDQFRWRHFEAWVKLPRSTTFVGNRGVESETRVDDWCGRRIAPKVHCKVGIHGATIIPGFLFTDQTSTERRLKDSGPGDQPLACAAGGPIRLAKGGESLDPS